MNPSKSYAISTIVFGVVLMFTCPYIRHPAFTLFVCGLMFLGNGVCEYLEYRIKKMDKEFMDVR